MSYRGMILTVFTSLVVFVCLPLWSEARTSMGPWGLALHECNFCHDLHGTGGGVIPPGTAEAVCDSCHAPGASSAPDATVHKDASVTFSMTCTRCHDPHVFPDNWDGGENLSAIGSTYNNSSSGGGLGTVNTPSSGVANVVFESRGTDATPPGTAADSFADGDSVYDGICEVCHTSTSYHQNTSAGDHLHNTGKQCTVCHAHDNNFKGEGACITCHNKQQGSAPYIFRQITEAGGDYVVNTSRHVFGGTPNNWDCIVCHAEGDITSYDADVATTSEHNDLNLGTFENRYYKTIGMRNVDSTANPGIANADFWRWPKTHVNNTPSDADHTRMDTFCMRCHDSDASHSRNGPEGGASGVAVLDNNMGVSNATQPPTLLERLRPFNPTDAIENTAMGNTGSAEPGADLTTWFGTSGACEAKGFTWNTGSSTCTDRRSRVVDIFGMFNTSNPSHHAVLGQRYTSNNGTDELCVITGERNCDTQTECENPGTGKNICLSVATPIWNSTFNQCIGTAYGNQTDCENADSDYEWKGLGWWSEAWADYTLKNGTSLKTERETVTLHCADCHTVDTNVHGANKSYMMTASTIDTTCFTCHNQTTYDGSSNNGESRFNHTTDSNVWSGSATGGSKLDPNSVSGENVAGMCVLCHGGAHYDGYGAIHGIPSGSDTRSSEPVRYRFIGGSTMSYSYDSNDWETGGTAGTCYFIDPDPQPWAYCDHHTAGTSSGSDSQYYRDKYYTP